MQWKSVYITGNYGWYKDVPFQEMYEEYGFLPLTKDATWALCHRDIGAQERILIAMASALSGPRSGEHFHDCGKTFYKGVCCTHDEDCAEFGYQILTPPQILWAILHERFSLTARRTLTALLWATWGRSTWGIEGGVLKDLANMPFVPDSQELREGLSELCWYGIVSADYSGPVTRHSINPTWEEWVLEPDQMASLANMMAEISEHLYFPVPDVA